MKTSAGLLLHRGRNDALEVLIAHPGGPFWAKKDAGVWSIPKGEYGSDEDPLDAAIREFTEELGSPPPAGEDVPLGQVRQSAKLVTVFARAGEFDVDTVRSNTVTIQWPPRSGRTIEVPEIDRAEWCDLAFARERLIAAQRAFLDRLVAALSPE